MSNLKALKLRIKSVKSTQKMTKAMKMVAASRLKKAKNLVEDSRPYANKIEEMITDLASNVAVRNSLKTNHPLLTGKGKNKECLMIVFSTDRGLCGGLNGATVKMAKARIATLEGEGKKVKLYFVGRKAYDQLKSAYGDKIVEQDFGLFKGEITFNVAKIVADKVVKLFDDSQFDFCEVVYSKFQSAIVQEQICKQLIPAPIEIKRVKQGKNFEAPVLYEPSEDEVLRGLLPLNLAMQIYNEMLENSASEQGARMAAMEAATNNAGKMIKDLTLVYNRTRQANITTELIDIISGANSV
ncbi:MAG: F0F1 ATP synthase subunit gamma [Rickettsiales bacterium]|nr:F0F1 ATP synthase subunit gamma [Rickettsiales bacterium]